MENTELVLSLLIPEVASSVEEQILTLKHTLFKLRGLPSLVKKDVSIGTLKYMQSLESQKTHGLMQSILDGLTETELEELQNLVEYAKEQSSKQASKKSTTPSARVGSYLRSPPRHGKVVSSLIPSAMSAEDFTEIAAKISAEVTKEEAYLKLLDINIKEQKND